MIKVINDTFPSADDRGTLIHAVEWLPEKAPIAVLQLVHGMTEYIERYDDFARYMVRHGFVVVGHDHIGHGESVDSKEDWGIMYTRRPDDVMVEDIMTNYRRAKEKYPRIPYFILGHSMGSYLVRKFLSVKSGQLEGLSGAVIMGTGTVPVWQARLSMAVLQFIARQKGWDYKSPLILFRSTSFTL